METQGVFQDIMRHLENSYKKQKNHYRLKENEKMQDFCKTENTKLQFSYK